jgi:thymidylate synthase
MVECVGGDLGSGRIRNFANIRELHVRFSSRPYITAPSHPSFQTVYGFQWRHFGAEYEGPGADYTNKGVDQVREVIRKLKENPYDRRIIISAWNVAGELKIDHITPCLPSLLQTSSFLIIAFIN